MSVAKSSLACSGAATADPVSERPGYLTSPLIFGGMRSAINSMSFRKRTCVVCGEVIDECVPCLQKYCSNRKCKWEYFDRIRKQIRSSRESLERKRERLKRQARDLRDNTAEAAGIGNPKDFTPTAIPVNMRRVRHLPEKRRRTFCDRLMQLIGQAATERCSSTRSKDDTTIQMNCDVQILDFTCRLLFRDTLASLFSTFCLCTVKLSEDELDGSDHHGLFSMSNNLTALRILVLHDAFNA